MHLTVKYSGYFGIIPYTSIVKVAYIPIVAFRKTHAVMYSSKY
jgi:hypothetical protein